MSEMITKRSFLPPTDPIKEQQEASRREDSAKRFREMHVKRNATADSRKKRLNYHRNYNETHRESLAELKRKRYKDDPKYRAAVMKRSKSAYEKRKLLRNAVRELASKGTLPRTADNIPVSQCPTCGRPFKPPTKPRMMIVRGMFEVMMYSIGVLAAKLGKQSRTIDVWIKNKVIPDALHKNKHGRRMWTQDQVEMLIRTCATFDLRPPINYRKCGFVEAALKGWRELLPEGGIDSKLYTLPAQADTIKGSIRRWRRSDAGELPPAIVTSNKVLYLEDKPNEKTAVKKSAPG